MIKVLEERGELGISHGNAMLGILVVQDLSLIPMAALLPALPALMEQGGNHTAALAGIPVACIAESPVSIPSPTNKRSDASATLTAQPAALPSMAFIGFCISLSAAIRLQIGPMYSDQISGSSIAVSE